jgi:hypothetical protein
MTKKQIQELKITKENWNSFPVTYYKQMTMEQLALVTHYQKQLEEA